MRLLKYWLGVLAYPLDVADRLLLLIGALLPVAQRCSPGVQQAMIHLLWQVPAAMVALVVVWRLLNAPLKIMDGIRAERRGEHKPRSLLQLDKRLQSMDEALEKQSKELTKRLTEQDERWARTTVILGLSLEYNLKPTQLANLNDPYTMEERARRLKLQEEFDALKKSISDTGETPK